MSFQGMKAIAQDAKAKAAFEMVGRKSGRESLSSEVSQPSKKKRLSQPETAHRTGSDARTTEK